MPSQPPPTPTAAPPRRAFVDLAKGIGILLVVFGHVQRGLAGAGVLAADGDWCWLDRTIYAFHMPLFFVLAGLFLLPERPLPFGAFAGRSLLRLGYPYLLWGLLQSVLQVALSGFTNRRLGWSVLGELPWRPPMQFWFLYALLLQTLAIGLLRACGLGRLGILVVAAVLHLIGPLLPLPGWPPLLEARHFLLFTALGVALGSPSLLSRFEALPRPLHLACALAGGGLLLGTVPLADSESRFLLLVPATAGIVATLGAAAVLAGAAGRGPALLQRGLARCGTATLAIFVAHTIASSGVRILLQRLLHVDSAAVHLLLGTVVGVAVPLLLLRWSARAGLPHLFAWPTRRPPPTPR